MISIENNLLQEMLSTLERVLEGKIHCAGTPSENSEISYVAEIATSGGNWLVPVEVKKQAYPRDVRQAVWFFDEFRRTNRRAGNIVPVFVAELISEGAREILKSHNIGYYESGGTFFIKNKQWLIDIRRPRQPGRKSGTIDLFSDAREKVVHALLQCHGDWFSGEELSSLSDTSAFTVSGVLRELERREWIVKSGEKGRSQRRRLNNPGDLLNAWADAVRERSTVKTYGYLFAGDPLDCVRKIERKVSAADNNIRWALTGALAANQASPLLTGVSVAEIIVSPDKTEAFLAETGISRAEKGYNIILHEWPPAGVQFIRKEDNLPFASHFVQYLSLLDGRGRNAELAEQFRRTILEI